MNFNKDYFSAQSEDYAKWRPQYPSELYETVFSKVSLFKNAWDCGTGNGQVASILSQKFDKVFASDISQSQLDQATPISNIHYFKANAESSNLDSNSIDLITVAQAMHWFEFPSFFREVHRVGNKDSLLAVWGYQFPEIDPIIDKIFNQYQDEIIGPYWPEERKYVDNAYTTINFPFATKERHRFYINKSWGLNSFLSFIGTGSAVNIYKKKTGKDSLIWLRNHLEPNWNTREKKNIQFPVFLILIDIKSYTA